MRPSLFFSAFEPLHNVPEVCDICDANPPVLRYQFDTYGQKGESKENKGFCCSHCAGKLLDTLQQWDESRRWAQEEYALKADDFDVSDFHHHRVAAFPKNWN